MNAHGQQGQWWATIGRHGGQRYPTVGAMRVDISGHYEQIYGRSGRSGKKFDGLIDALKHMEVVIIAFENRKPDGIYKRQVKQYIGLFEVLNFKVTYFGILRRVEFDVGDCIIPMLRAGDQHW
jgi:hypothetical protein